MIGVLKLPLAMAGLLVLAGCAGTELQKAEMSPEHVGAHAPAQRGPPRQEPRRRPRARAA